MFYPGKVWHDNTGEVIQAHSAGILFDQGTYYWFGEHKGGPTRPGGGRVDVIGVSCYSSHNLVDWTYEGLALPAVPDQPEHDLHPSKVLERPKVIYNDRTRTYVMWMHIDTANYKYARTGIAVSETPAGPYRYLKSIEPCGLDSRDMTLYKDDDGSAYLLFASGFNTNLTIVRLTDDYLHTTDEYSQHFVVLKGSMGREAPAIFKHEGRYFLITSGCSGWNANPAEYAVATSLHGPWQVQGNPCVGDGAEKTFEAQSTFVLPVAGKPGAFIFLADRWNPKDLADSRYVWLPISVQGEQLLITWYDAWDLSVFE